MPHLVKKYIPNLKSWVLERFQCTYSWSKNVREREREEEDILVILTSAIPVFPPCAGANYSICIIDDRAQLLPVPRPFIKIMETLRSTSADTAADIIYMRKCRFIANNNLSLKAFLRVNQEEH